MFRLQNGEIYYEDQTQEYKDDLKNKRCIVCKYKNLLKDEIPCLKCETRNFVASKIKGGR